MKIIKLNEQKLVEKEVLGKKPEDVQLDADTKQLMKDGKYKDAYFKVAGPETGDSSYFIYIEYTPTKKQIDAATKLNGVILGYSGSPLKGYLKESANKKLKVGWFSGNAGAELLGIVDGSNSSIVIKEPYISLVADTKDATAYSEKDAKELIKKLSEKETGITSVKEEKAPSKKEAFFKEYLNTKFPGKEAKIKDFRKELIGLLIALEFKENPMIEFLAKYLEKYDMTRSGFITLNNLYSQADIDDIDFTGSDITPLLMSNLLVNTGTADAAYIIASYKDLIYSYEDFNIPSMLAARDEKNPSANLDYDSDGGLKGRESKQNLADLVIFAKGKINDVVEPVDKIKALMSKLRIKNTGKAKPSPKATTNPAGESGKPSIVVSGGVAKGVAPETERKFDSIFNNVDKGEIPELMAYLKNKKLIG
jgi:hypothetical protein